MSNDDLGTCRYRLWPYRNRGRTRYVATPLNLLGSELYRSELARCMSYGGHWRRRTRQGPGGFRFDSETAARDFVADDLVQDDVKTLAEAGENYPRPEPERSPDAPEIDPKDAPF